MNTDRLDTAPPAELGQGSVIGGKYRVERLLGSGGMGAVYEAVNTWTDRRVAVKLLHREYAKKPEIVGRFLREAKAATAVTHPNIVDVLDMGEDRDAGGLFIVQEFLEGKDLARRIGEEPALGTREGLTLMVPVMSALVAAHRLGIVHRDIKPENIFLTTNARGVTVPKVIDFGISKVLDAAGDARAKTQTGVAIGTPQYMSPEQARGRPDIDGRSDIWSVGVVLYELVAGRLPFDAPNYNLLIVSILTTPAPPLADVAPGVSTELAAVIHRALETDPAARYASMAEFLEALLACPLDDGQPLVEPGLRDAYLTGVAARDSDGTARAPSLPAKTPVEALAPTAEAEDFSRAQTPIEWQRPASSWLPQVAGGRAALGAVMLLLLGAVGTIGVVWGRSSAPPSPPRRVAAVAPPALQLAPSQPAPPPAPAPIVDPPAPLAAAPSPVAALVPAATPSPHVPADAGVLRTAPVRPRTPATTAATNGRRDPLAVDTNYPGSSSP